MNYETKYAPGDKVWMMREDKPLQAEVFSLALSHDTECHTTPNIQFGFRFNYPSESRISWFRETSLYPTKEALLASL